MEKQKVLGKENINVNGVGKKKSKSLKEDQQLSKQSFLPQQQPVKLSPSKMSEMPFMVVDEVGRPYFKPR